MFIGVDIGGTSIKVGLVSKSGSLKAKESFPVIKGEDQKVTIEKLGDFILCLAKENKLNVSEIEGIGIGCPGAINSEKGTCDSSPNLKWSSLPVVDIIKNKTGVRKVRISNDANVAALGEALFGAGKKYNSSIFITLGTGVGGGVVIDRKLFEGNEGKGTEIGHSVIVIGGEPCGCGRKGCFEAYASATALIRLTKEVMKKNPKSYMWHYVHGDIDQVDGKTAFESSKAMDKAALEVVDTYCMYLAEGMLNYMNIFRPNAIILGGGICGQKEYLTSRLEKYVRSYHFGFKSCPEVEILIASLGNDAGIIGAASIVM